GRRRTMGVFMMLSSAVILFTPFVEDIWLLVALFTISLTGMATAISLNFSLVNDLLRNPEDSGKAMSILIVGGNLFGVAAPIVTGYVIQATGSYNWAFGIAGLLLVTGATILYTMTRTPIEIARSAARTYSPQRHGGTEKKKWTKVFRANLCKSWRLRSTIGQVPFDCRNLFSSVSLW
ncbi:MAG TPA: MFS transporter, partial [Burkholderiales bacterium]